MLESSSAKLWGALEDGTNQGAKHFTEQVLKVKNNGILREINGKQIYYLEG